MLIQLLCNFLITLQLSFLRTKFAYFGYYKEHKAVQRELLTLSTVTLLIMYSLC